jgi:glycerol-3-phosphate dehydrogenase
LGRDWDLIIIGGGITGAGILNLAARCGLKALLVEQNDFASGTSSRSSKLVHGGLRYLRQFHIKLTHECILERLYLLKHAPGLVEPLDFIYPLYRTDGTQSWMVHLGLSLYTHLSAEAGSYHALEPSDIAARIPGLAEEGLVKGYRFQDASTDDARLVLRVLSDGLNASGGKATALNYTRVTGFLKAGERVAGVGILDRETGRTAEAFGSVVINATGAWADLLRAELGAPPRLRPLRGSHLLFPRSRLPVPTAVMLGHPYDGRPLFILPWEGITLVGTTDVDHPLALDEEPFISDEERTYLMDALDARFPNLNLTEKDVLATQAGVRPVVRGGKTDPSSESREHVLWEEQGLLTVTGGKLTTFRLIAIEALRKAHALSPKIPRPMDDMPVLDPPSPDPTLPGLKLQAAVRLWGRHGASAPWMVQRHPDLMDSIPGTPYLWAELAWAAQNEAVVHLDDLLLRRLRLGLLLGEGAQRLLPRIKEVCAGSLGWDDDRWRKEIQRFLKLMTRQ